MGSRGAAVSVILWVLDCSAVSAFLLAEKPGADAVEPILTKAAAGEARILMPALFWFEVLNFLVNAERKGRLSSEQAAILRDETRHLPLETEWETGPVERRRIHELALLHRISAYDAAYLEIAERQGSKLKSLDRDLLALKPKYPWIE